jgi:hypothetical protein
MPQDFVHLLRGPSIESRNCRVGHPHLRHHRRASLYGIGLPSCLMGIAVPITLLQLSALPCPGGRPLEIVGKG